MDSDTEVVMAFDRIQLDPPRAVRKIANRLEDAGYETWCVGGAVRDALLGRTHLDWDLATQATPDVVQSLFRATKPVGIEFGTVAVFDRGVQYEITTFRRDVRTDGRHAEVEFGVSLDEDLARRDFTINAIAYSPRRAEWRDPFDGRADLERRVVRAVGDPAARMTEDRLRALRALRFAARFDFTIEPETWKAIVESAPYLVRLSRERVKQELEKTMEQVICPSRAIEMWRTTGALQHLIPELATQPSVAFGAADHIALPDATTRRELASSRVQNRLTTLFLGVAPERVRRILRDLRFSNRSVDWMGQAAASWNGMHDAIGEMLIGRSTVAASTMRRWVADIGRTRARDFLRVCAARWSAERAAGLGAPEASAVATLYRRAIRTAYRDPVSVNDLAVGGNDLADIGIPPGPRVGEILRRLLDYVLEDPARNTRDEMLAFAAQLRDSSDTIGVERGREP